MKMHLCFAVIAFCFGAFNVAFAGDLLTQIELTGAVCSGISDSMYELKKMAGINTAVTVVGTVAGGVALGTGIAKKSVDDDYESLKSKIADLIATQQNQEIHIITDETKFYTQLDEFMASYTGDKEVLQDDKERLKDLEEKSKNLGNIRTGTLATTAVADTVGAVIAAKNKVDDDLESRIVNCIAEVKKLKNVKMQAQIENSSDPEKIGKADVIIRECGEWEYVDLSDVNKKSKGAALSSGAGAAMAIIGTISSVSANSNSVRQNNDKEKNLNVASNILAGGAAGASAVATIFNATQIKAIKKAADVADKCEGVLK